MNRYILFLKKYFLLSSITLLLFSASCQKSDTPTPIPPRTRDTSRVPTSNTAVNTWITDSMRIYYYWNESIPNDAGLNLKLAPPDFFKSIRDPADRFSWIQNVDDLNDNLAGVSTSTGLNILSSLLSYDKSSNLLGVVGYVVPGSPADKLGIKRGMFFTEVNGTKMTSQNYETLLAPYIKDESFQITLATIEDGVVKTGSKINLTVARVDEPSVYYHKIFTTNSSKKVGYIFYNRFLNEKADELFSVFNEFKSAGVNELILDLRYNLGGGISVSGVLAALIKSNYNKDQIFVNYNYNKLLNALIKDRDDSFAKLFPAVSSIQNTNNAINDIDSKVKNANLNLSKVYILGTSSSASASELVIHNLAPYMQVIHIGDTTLGKNEGSITIEDTRKPRVINWALQPIIVKLADKNGDGDYDQGLIPDYQVDETDVLPLLPIGSEDDPLVAKALSLIDPIASPQVRARTMAIPPTPLLQKVSFSNQFIEKMIKAKPVPVDGTIDTEALKKIKEGKSQ